MKMPAMRTDTTEDPPARYRPPVKSSGAATSAVQANPPGHISHGFALQPCQLDLKDVETALNSLYHSVKHATEVMFEGLDLCTSQPSPLDMNPSKQLSSIYRRCLSSAWLDAYGTLVRPSMVISTFNVVVAIISAFFFDRVLHDTEPWMEYLAHKLDIHRTLFQLNATVERQHRDGDAKSRSLLEIVIGLASKDTARQSHARDDGACTMRELMFNLAKTDAFRQNIVREYAERMVAELCATIEPHMGCLIQMTKNMPFTGTGIRQTDWKSVVQAQLQNAFEDALILKTKLEGSESCGKSTEYRTKRRR